MVYVSCMYNTYIYVQYGIRPKQYVFVCILYVYMYMNTDTFIQEQKIFISDDTDNLVDK